MFQQKVKEGERKENFVAPKKLDQSINMIYKKREWNSKQNICIFKEYWGVHFKCLTISRLIYKFNNKSKNRELKIIIIFFKSRCLTINNESIVDKP